MDELAIKIEHVSKEYRLGTIGGGTLRGDLQSWWARLRGKEDPNSKIGSAATHGGDRFLALDDVSIQVKKGEALGIIGHNGAGKSTLLKLLSRVTAPTRGTIAYNGRIASMLEVGTGFHPELTGRENVYLNGAIIGYSKAYIDEKYKEIVAFAELDGFMGEKVRNYSSGMVSRLGFAIATARDTPEILILDEVLSVGDLFFRKKSEARIREMIHAGSTVLIVSHSPGVIRANCTKAIWLERGRLQAVGPPEAVCSAYENRKKGTGS